MSANYERRFRNCVEESRMGSLPEHLIDAILERVPIRDAVRTSILSKKWRHRWTTMKALVFDEQFSTKIAKYGAFGRNGFIRIINHVLILHKGPILKFHLHIPKISLDSFQEVDQWMQLLSTNGVTELILTNSNRRYELPSYVFSCLELTKLDLKKCFFKPPFGFEGFPNLEKLFLMYIDFGANMCGTQINLPQLKVLSLHHCTNVYNFKIKATQLQSLVVWDSPDAMLLQLLDSPCLLKLGIYFQKPTEGLLRTERINLRRMLSNLPRIEGLYLDRDFFKYVMEENMPNWVPHAVKSIKYFELLLIQLGDLVQLHGVLCLLRISPNVERLWISPSVDSGVDEGPASDHLESPKCLDCTLSQLKTVEMSYIEGSRPEMLFIKLLLAHSPSLEKFTITICGRCDSQKILDIVMEFPRASPKAEIIYLNPKLEFL